MPFGLGFFATAGVRAAAGSFDLLSTQVLTSSQASITFNLAGTGWDTIYQHLHIRYTEYYTAGGNSTTMRFNGDSGANYSTNGLWASGGASNSTASVVNSEVFMYSNMLGIGHTSDSNFRAVGSIDILDPFEATKRTSIRTLWGQAQSPGNAGIVGLHGGFWNNTASVTSITFGINGAMQFNTGTRYSLYGVKAA